MHGLGITNGHMHIKLEQETNYTLTMMETLVGDGEEFVHYMGCIQLIEDGFISFTNQLLQLEKYFGQHLLEKPYMYITKQTVN
jgi:hypothetical protein